MAAMDERKLKTGILGLNERGRELLEAVSKIEYFELAAVADKDPSVAEKLAEEYECENYDDYRQLVMQNQLDCLLVAAGMHSCDEYVRAGMKKKFNVLKLAPPARNFEEAAEFVKLAEEEGVRFAVANAGRFLQSYLAMREYVRAGRLEQPFMITGFCNAGDEPGAAWSTDPKLAGGGVLLHDCYEMIDQMMWNFPLPQQVYCLMTNQAQDKRQRLYLTEDTATVTMKFSDRLLGSVVACRRAGIGPRQEFVRVYAREAVLTVSGSRLTVSNSLGRTSEEFEFDIDRAGRLRQVLENFALAIIRPEEQKLSSSGRENLKNMAVIESAYLSARTAMPEEPGKILHIAQLEPESIG